MPELARPILLAADEIDGVANAFGYPTEVLGAAIEAKIADGSYRDGVFEATELILKEAAVLISFVDKDDRGAKIRDEDIQAFIRAKLLIGFNDHAGGSESGFKILLNCFFEGEEPSQYVLWSPPDEEGLPSNTTFRKVNFTFPSMEADGIERRGVPNPLKTASAARYLGRKFYDFLLIGDKSVPQRIPAVFKAIGFSFETEPFEVFSEEYSELRRLEAVAESKAAHPWARHWPKDQFAQQITAIRSLE